MSATGHVSPFSPATEVKAAAREAEPCQLLAGKVAGSEGGFSMPATAIKDQSSWFIPLIGGQGGI